MPNSYDNSRLEKYSSAFSLSDMEIFVFPDLLFPLVLANIMSPIIWTWREDPWFANLAKKSFNYKMNRIKQYIMDHYVFNLDLDTWGLTNKDREVKRFRNFVDMDIVRQSNALFGYEGDKYYFNIDIRRHFGLDKYTTDIIPYWKTETVEAMTAFRFKGSFRNGAGECVSFSALYAAALFIVGRVPLKDIYLISTPLHSQDFIDFQEGILTNNRRIVTKKMWFNGTSLSTRARRALENEKVSVVSHISGYIHYMYKTATIHRPAYLNFTEKLKDFLTIGLTPSVFLSFLRYHMNFKKCFQYRHIINEHPYYIALETLFEYEHNTKINYAENTREALLKEIDDEEFSLAPLENRIVIQDVENYLDKNKGSLEEVTDHFIERSKTTGCNNEEYIRKLFHDLGGFIHVHPKLPDLDKQFIMNEPLEIRTDHSREDIIQLINEKAAGNETALLSLYVFRQMDKIEWQPFMKAAIERNPVSLAALKGKTEEVVYALISEMPNESIYDGKRLAQPDEVWNFGLGDGIEKAVLFANYLCNELGDRNIKLGVHREHVILTGQNGEYNFFSSKELIKNIDLAELVQV